MSKKQNYKDDPTTPKVLKVRCGNPKGGGKGALANENQAFTLAVTNDQVLFQPIKDREEQKNETVGVDIYNFSLTGEVGRTIATPSGGLEEHIPCVIETYGFDTYNQEITKETSQTLRTPSGGDSTAKIIMTEYHPNDSRMKIDKSGTCQTLTGRMGTGGNNVPVLLVVNDQGGGVIRTEKDDISPTLRAEMHQHPPTVVMVFEPGSSTRVGGHVYVDGKTGTIRANPGDNQQCVVEAHDG